MKPASWATMSFVRSRLVSGAFLLATSVTSSVSLAEPAACGTATPPAPAKPYILLLVDSSGSMSEALGGTPSCDNSVYPASKSGQLRCGLHQVVDALGGQSRVGVMAFPGFAQNQTGAAPATCPSDLGISPPGCSVPQRGCGTGTGTTRSASTIVVPIAQDDLWNSPPTVASNAASLLGYFDNRCDDYRELTTTGGSSPINGALRDAYRYLSGSYTLGPPYTQQYFTPLVGAGKDLPCRPVKVVLLTDGGETCDSAADLSPVGQGAVNAAKTLRDGLVVGGVTWHVPTHVIQLGGTITALDAAIASAAGTTPVLAQNADDVATAVGGIIANAVAPEICDNLDNDCNGCTDDGFAHYCNRNKTARTLAQLFADPGTHTTDVCCNGARGSFAGPADNTTCLGAYRTELAATGTPPSWFLPCADAAAATTPAQWLCESGGERCDGVDNDCSGGAAPTVTDIDEGTLRCTGNDGQLHCPAPETCDGQDNDCNGSVDDVTGGGTSCTTTTGCAGVGQCTAGGFACVASVSPEVCDGLDNDCDGLVDETRDDDASSPMVDVGGPCGQSTGECRLGTTVCDGRGTPAASVRCDGATDAQASDPCDGKDNDCDGAIDEDVDSQVGTDCSGCGFTGTYQCRGAIVCVNGAQIGDAELCNGKDDNCDGRIDENVPGVGEACGTDTSPCGRGVFACSSDDGGVPALRCARPASAPQPSTETCDSVDNDCNGVVDDEARCDAGNVCVGGECVPAQTTEVIDAGVPARDAGPPPEPPPASSDDYTLSGGCAAAGDASGSSVWLLAAALLLGRRRTEKRS